MKCKHCNGFGWYYNDITDTKKIKCECCGGTGEVEQTNEEWFCKLSTEEKATFLASNKMLNFDYQMWVEWLKEKNNG